MSEQMRSQDAALETRTEQVAREIVDAALAVHRSLGPGLLESAYEHCLAHELSLRGLNAARQQVLPIAYRDLSIDAGYRLDLLVENRVIIEVKAVERVMPVHEAQLLTYLKLSGLRLGFLMNFNTALLKHGLRRVIL